MMVFHKTVLGLATAMTIAAMPASAQQRWDWHGGFRGDRDYALRGPGVRLLIPELRATNRGRAFVVRNFDRNRDGLIERREADAANRAFIQIAGPRRDRFDWDARDHVVAVPVERGGWDHRGMRDYHMRQTRYGATFDLSDVLFETDSAALRPAAIDKLRPLGGYLKANPAVRLRIDGYTDSRASDAHNQTLSEHRAQSVESALAGMGVSEQRMQAQGHGENEPVATNATASGRQQNRRVSVTLIGQQASRFAE
ncbi:OmpA family protein [Sphingomonas koreensis]|nr:OmpA family protein [Sphingomonas koreensis]